MNIKCVIFVTVSSGGLLARQIEVKYEHWIDLIYRLIKRFNTKDKPPIKAQRKSACNGL